MQSHLHVGFADPGSSFSYGKLRKLYIKNRDANTQLNIIKNRGANSQHLGYERLVSLVATFQRAGAHHRLLLSANFLNRKVAKACQDLKS